MEFPRRAGLAAEELEYLHAKERRPDGQEAVGGPENACAKQAQRCLAVVTAGSGGA